MELKQYTWFSVLSLVTCTNQELCGWHLLHTVEMELCVCVDSAFLQYSATGSPCFTLLYNIVYHARLLVIVLLCHPLTSTIASMLVFLFPGSCVGKSLGTRLPPCMPYLVCGCTLSPPYFIPSLYCYVIILLVSKIDVLPFNMESIYLEQEFPDRTEN